MTVEETHYVERKVCSKCQAHKPITEYNFRNRLAGIRHSYCKECGKHFTHRHYERNKSQYLDRNARAYAKRKALVLQMKSRPCADCGVQYPYYVMDFDHREGVLKSFALNSVNRVTMRAIIQEIEKCDVVCANCHRERTQRRKAWKRVDT
jgi:hypothetical protein